jgi:hypothetical protein
MNKEKQRIAIAEACGWKDVKYTYHEEVDIENRSIIHWSGLTGIPPEFIHYENRIKIPDYLTDLNAIHEAMAHLEPDQVNQFAAELSGIVLENREKYWWDLTSNEVGHVANATAAQRAEAFLRTVGKWEDDK